MPDSSRQSARRRVFAVTSIFVATACATTGGSSPAATAPAPQGAAGEVVRQAPAWRVRTMEHVDLWLHGFAMLTSDTGHVPFFVRDYKRDMTARKKQQNVHSQLDANQQELSARFAANPSLTNAQFLAMYFSSLDDIVNATDLFFRSQGNPRAASDPRVQQQIAMLAANFPSAADRNWLRLFVASIRDESSRFFHAYWVGEQAARGAAFAGVNELWAQSFPKLSRFLNNTQQQRGEVLLSLPIGGEGRTINDGKQSNIVAVTFPKTIEAAPEALFVFAHEVVGRLAQEAITDNVTPAEQRSGAANEYIGNGAVRGGALLLQRILPDLVPDYMRFYLRTLGRTPPAGDPSAAFAAAFPLPATILNSMNTQIGIVLGGI